MTLNPDIMLWKLKADAERARAEAAENDRDVLTYKLEQCQRSQDMIVRRAEAAEKRVKELEDALTASGETKAAYIGEFHFYIEDRDEEGEDFSRQITVPWTTIKEIMKAVLARAALEAKP